MERLMSGEKSKKTKAEGKTNNLPKRRTITVEEAAEILGIGRSTAFRYVQSGKIPSIKIGNRVLLTDTIIERLLAGA
jgi:excisionase family DNA binding protein